MSELSSLLVMPYTSNAFEVQHSPTAFRPFGYGEAVDSDDVCASVYSEYAAVWAARNAGDYGQIYVPGERTFGVSHPATDEFMVDFITDGGVSRTDIVTTYDSRSVASGLNNSVVQLSWADEIRRDSRDQRDLTVAAFEFHIPRIKLICDTLGIEADTVPIEGLGASVGQPDLAQVINEASVDYEEKAMKVHRRLARFGAAALENGIDLITLARTPNVVDFVRQGGPVRQHLQTTARSRVQQLALAA